MLRTGSVRGAVRTLSPGDLDAAVALADRDPVGDLFVASRLHQVGVRGRAGAAELWGYEVDGRLDAMCYVGANVVPVRAGPDAVRAFADRARRRRRPCSSIVGRAEAVGPLWAEVAAAWGPARSVREDQPLMALTRRADDIEPDPGVRHVRHADFDTVMPACVAMFTEEVGVSPVEAGGAALYRARVRELIDAGRAFARIEDGKVVFKAEIGAVTPSGCQVQGVWVAPPWRGRGLSVPALAAVIDHAQRELAPIVSLYVNSYNQAALAAYRRVGFGQVGRFMSVLF